MCLEYAINFFKKSIKSANPFNTKEGSPIPGGKAVGNGINLMILKAISVASIIPFIGTKVCKAALRAF